MSNISKKHTDTLELDKVLKMLADRCGMTAANDILPLLTTLAVVTVPLVLLLTLYLLYRKNTKNLCTD